MASGGTIAVGVVLLVLGVLIFLSLGTSSQCSQYDNIFQQDQYNSCVQGVQEVDATAAIVGLLGIILIPVGAAIGGSNPVHVYLPMNQSSYSGGQTSGVARQEQSFAAPPPTPAPSRQPPPPPPEAGFPSAGAQPVPGVIPRIQTYCPYCGIPGRSEFRFCRGCGREFPHTV